MPEVRRKTQDYLNMMRHALGKSTTETGTKAHKLIHDLNDAGRALVNAHPWTWRNRSGVVIDQIADQEWVELPADFGQLVSVEAVNAQTFRVHPTSIGDINRMRAWAQYDAQNTYIAFDDAAEAADQSTGVVQNRAQIYPTPTTNRSEIEISYRAKWIDMSDDDPDRVPLIPRDWERSLVLFARSFAIDIENQVDPYENQALFGPMGEIQRLIVEDSGRQVDRGEPLHRVSKRGRGLRYPHRSISR